MSDVSADALLSIRRRATARATTHDQPILGHLRKIFKYFISSLSRASNNTARDT